MADVFAYEVTGIGSDLFGVIDLTTGVFTSVGNMGQTLAGIGSYGGVIYGGAHHGNTLYSINTSTGALTAIGTGNVSYGDFGSTTSGLYAFGLNGDLYSINPTNGAATDIGPTGLSFGGTVMGMSSGSSTLYLTQNNLLYSLNTTNGSATLIGNTNEGESGFGSLVSVSGTLYGGAYGAATPDVYSLDPQSGTATFVAASPSTPSSPGVAGFWGLAPISNVTIPQGATWLSNPTSGDWNTGSNWSAGSVPIGTATFGASNVTTLTISDNASSIQTIQFTVGAPAYSFVGGLSITGEGIVNNSSFSPHFTNNGNLDFSNASTAGNAVITGGGGLQFLDTSTAGNASISSSGILQFLGTSTAGNANIINGYVLRFGDTSTAGNASITNNSIINFNGESTAGDASITNNDVVHFGDTSTAGNAIITNNSPLFSGGALQFFDNSNGGQARFINNSGAIIDFSGTAGLNNDGRLSAGSIEGAGNYYLGSNQLVVGSNNLSTIVSGVISDVGYGSLSTNTGGSLVKIGTGTLTLSGTNTYTGGTTLDGGTLDLAALGAAGSGTITLETGSQILQIENAALSANAFGDSIDSFGRGDVIDLSGLVFHAGAIATYDPNSHMLTVTSNGITDTLTLINPDGTAFKAMSDGASGTKIVLIPAVTESLAHDTGMSASDKITSDPTLTGTGDANAVVSFTVDGNPIAVTASANASGIWIFTPPDLLDGLHTIVASETDAAGNAGTASLTFRLDTTAPVAAITDIVRTVSHHTSTTTLSGTSEAGSAVTLYEGTQTLGTTTADSTGHWNISLSNLSDVVHKLTAAAADMAGNIGASSQVAVFGSTGADNIVGVAGGDLIVGSGGPDKLTAGPGADTFVFHPNFGKDTISHFDLSQDVLAFDHNLFADISAVLSHTSDVHGNAVIAYDHADTVTLVGVTTAQLLAHQSDVHII